MLLLACYQQASKQGGQNKSEITSLLVTFFQKSKSGLAVTFASLFRVHEKTDPYGYLPENLNSLARSGTSYNQVALDWVFTVHFSFGGAPCRPIPLISKRIWYFPKQNNKALPLVLSQIFPPTILYFYDRYKCKAGTPWPASPLKPLLPFLYLQHCDALIWTGHHQAAVECTAPGISPALAIRGTVAPTVAMVQDLPYFEVSILQ